MSVRRLAEDSIQPGSFSFSATNARWVKTVVRKYPPGRQASAVIPLLMRAQEQEGWVTRASIEAIAEMLSMPYIRALEVATFYTQFQLKPVGTSAHVQVCGTTPCMLRGSQDLIEVCKRKINPQPFDTNADGTLSWEEVECQGACVNAPMVMVFKDTYEDLTPERLEEIIDAFEAGKGETIAAGPQIDRVYAAPFGGLTTLTDADKTSKNKPTRRKSKPVSGGHRPAKLRKPAKPDDLKLISGVGPKLEGVLNGLGIYTFKQVAGWKAKECQWVDDALNFKGRIGRDEWVKQAKTLARGGKAEYIKVFGKKPR